jgi:hypothetical protein
MNISGFTTDNTVSTGAVSQSDFRKYGKIELTFHVNERLGFIGISIAGFESFRKFYLKPTEKQKATNSEFYDKYIKNFSEKEKIDAIIK